MVRDSAQNLPLSVDRTKRVLLEVLGDYPSSERVSSKMKLLLEEKGFQVELYEKEDFQKGVEVPVVFVSVANPYHLLDVPMIDTYINCYSNTDYILEALVEKLIGKSEFKGISPVDPYGGRDDLKG